MMSTALEPVRKRGMPVSIWLTLLASTGLHILLLMDFQFAHYQGNGEKMHVMRVQLETTALPVTRASQQRQQPDKPTPSEKSMDLEKDSTKKPNEVSEVHHTQARYQEASEVAAARGEQQDLRLRYIESLLRQIEAKKYYPSTARRRGIQGRIKVNFTLYDAGDIRDIRIAGESELLKRVSREALEQALPFAAAPEGVVLPLAVQYIMDYSLN